jgi:hypothetical protein
MTNLNAAAVAMTGAPDDVGCSDQYAAITQDADLAVIPAANLHAFQDNRRNITGSAVT